MSYVFSLKQKIESLFQKNFSNSCIYSFEICYQKLLINFAHHSLAKKYMQALHHHKIISSETGDGFFNLYVLDVGMLGSQDFPNFLSRFFNKIEFSAIVKDYKNSYFFAFNNFAYFYDMDHHFGIWFVHDHETFSPWHFANPFRFFLYDWLQQRQYQLVHASGVSNGRSGLLFAGPSGSGKSTMALFASKKGYSLFGDDHCAFSLDPVPRAFSLYNTIKLDVKYMNHEFQEFERFAKKSIHTQKSHKVIINLAEVDSNLMDNDLPIKAIVCLSINTNISEPVLLPINTREALKSLLLYTIEQCAWTGRKASMVNMQNLVSRVPCFHLTLCPDYEKNLAEVGRLFYV